MTRKTTTALISDASSESDSHALVAWIDDDMVVGRHTRLEHLLELDWMVETLTMNVPKAEHFFCIAKRSVQHWNRKRYQNV
jgi:hypothetical protein